MKEITWDNENKMHFESAHKTFNKQTTYISPGNVLGNTQYSSYIRKSSETECNGTWPVGHLQQYDLKPFREKCIPFMVLKKVEELVNKQEGSCILYCFRHWVGPKGDTREIIDGVVLTTGYPECKHIETWFLNNDWRAMDAVMEARKYVTNENEREKKND